jgi:senataxin
MGKLIKENTSLTESGEKTLKKFSLRKITALSTLEREYRALHKFHELQLKQLILSIDAQPKVYSYFTIPYKLDLKLHEIYNKSQYDAI